MAEAIVVHLPGLPVGKGRPRFARATGRAYTPARTVNYEAALRLAAHVAMAGRAPLDEPLSVAVLAMMPVPRSWSRKKTEAALHGVVRPTGRPDADNLLKALDALNAIVFRDDSLIVEASISKIYSDTPGMRISVCPLGQHTNASAA